MARKRIALGRATSLWNGSSDLLKAIQELLESRAVSSWGDEERLFVAVTGDLKEVFGRKGSVVDFLPELKWNDGILNAVDYQKGGVDSLQPGLGVELPMNKKADAREKPEKFASNSRSGRKRGLKNYACNLAASCHVGGDGGA